MWNGYMVILARHAEWLYGYIGKAGGMAIWLYWQSMPNGYMVILAKDAEWLCGCYMVVCVCLGI
jgi:hypothetical protein